MNKVRVAAFSVSVDGFGAGPRQDMNNPARRPRIGVTRLVSTDRSVQKDADSNGREYGRRQPDPAQSFENVGAWILGRNMFGPVRGPWKDDSWKGWWGGNPPYHTPVFVLTHHARPALPMEGGTTFHFVTDGVESALKKAKEAADGKDVRIGGGVSTIRQYLVAGLIDEMHLAVSPVCWAKVKIYFPESIFPNSASAQKKPLQEQVRCMFLLRRDNTVRR